MIIGPTLTSSHWLEFVYTECCHDVILHVPAICSTTQRHIFYVFLWANVFSWFELARCKYMEQCSKLFFCLFDIGGKIVSSKTHSVVSCRCVWQTYFLLVSQVHQLPQETLTALLVARRATYVVDGRFFGHFFWKVEGTVRTHVNSSVAHVHGN